MAHWQLQCLALGIPPPWRLRLQLALGATATAGAGPRGTSFCGQCKGTKDSPYLSVPVSLKNNHHCGINLT